MIVFFFKQKTAYEMRISDWSSDVCSSYLGNMQKVILARVLSAGPRVILANQPTRGLDVGAAAKVQEFLYAARAAGAGIVLLSEDLEEDRKSTRLNSSH